MPARNCDYPRALAIAKGGNLRRAGKAGANNPNANGFVITQFFQTPLQNFLTGDYVAGPSGQFFLTATVFCYCLLIEMPPQGFEPRTNRL